MDEMCGANQGRITVTGLGRVAAPNDAALIRLRVEVTGTTPGEALSACAGVGQRMVAAAVGAGVDESAVRTRGTAVGRQPENQGRRAAIAAQSTPQPPSGGYTARLDLVLTVDEITTVGPVTSAALTAGGDHAQLHELIPVVRDTARTGATARDLAYADAKVKAEQYARLAGQRLGRLLDLTDTGQERGHHPRDGLVLLSGGGMLDVHPGEYEMQVAVSATWELLD